MKKKILLCAVAAIASLPLGACFYGPGPGPYANGYYAHPNGYYGYDRVGQHGYYAPDYYAHDAHYGGYYR